MAKRTQTEDLADRLHSAAIRLLRLVRVQDTGSGIAPARLSALSVIVFGGPVSLRDLARAEQVRPPTMSRIVDALEVKALACRQVNRQDRRAVLIEATEKGAALLKQSRKRAGEVPGFVSLPVVQLRTFRHRARRAGNPKGVTTAMILV